MTISLHNKEAQNCHLIAQQSVQLMLIVRELTILSSYDNFISAGPSYLGKARSIKAATTGYAE